MEIGQKTKRNVLTKATKHRFLQQIIPSGKREKIILGQYYQ